MASAEKVSATRPGAGARDCDLHYEVGSSRVKVTGAIAPQRGAFSPPGT